MPAVIATEQYIAAAMSHRGWVEARNNGTPYGITVGAPHQAWCMSFLAAVAESMFGTKDVVPFTASTTTMAKMLKDRETDPHPGAIAYRTRVGGGHVGLVTSVAPSVATIEGNSNLAGSATGGAVVWRPRPSTPWLKFFAPRYPVPPAGLKLGCKGAFVRDLQELIGLKGADVDGEFGEATRAALIVWQKAHGLTGAGVWGPRSTIARIVELA